MVVKNITKTIDMKKELIFLFTLLGALVFAGCDSKESVDVNIHEIKADKDDAELEILANRVGYYYGEKPDLTLIEFCSRAAGQYCIFPKTESRKEELEQLAQQDGSQVMNAGGFFLVTRSRDFITADDFVSDRYFAGYYDDFHTGEITHDYVVICPLLGVCVYDTKTKDKILKDYSGKLTLRGDYEEGLGSNKDCYIYYFDCHLNTSEQLLNLSNKIYLRNDVKWVAPDMYSPYHLSV